MKEYLIHELISIKIAKGLENTNKIYDFLESIHDSDCSPPNNYIEINKVEDIDLSKHREYADGIYISPYSLIDNKYGIEVINKGNKIILNTKFRFIEWLMYSIQLALMKVDSVLIHGAAVAKDGKAILFPSWGGVGKTAILNDFAKKYNYKIIGDDLFILTLDGTIYSFLKPMVLYPYHKNLFPEVFKKSPSLIPTTMTGFMSKMVPKVKKLLSPFPVLMNFARNHNPQVKWALPSEVFGKDKIIYKTKVQSVYWLERSKYDTEMKLNNVNVESRIIGSTINEFDQRVVFCVNVMMGLGLIHNDLYLQKWYQVLNSGLNGTKKGIINVNMDVSIEEIGTTIKR